MAEIVYVLCALTSLLCAALLGRAYLRSRTRLLFWSALCFVGLAASNGLLFIDLVLVPSADLRQIRALLALAGISTMLFGLIWGAGE